MSGLRDAIRLAVYENLPIDMPGDPSGRARIITDAVLVAIEPHVGVPTPDGPSMDLLETTWGPGGLPVSEYTRFGFRRRKAPRTASSVEGE